MTGNDTAAHDLRRQAARIAAALLRFERLAAHPLPSSTPPGVPRVGTDAYVFLPSWRPVPDAEVERFLVALESPALLAPTTVRGTITVTLLHELSGERRRWAEKTFTNFTDGLDEVTKQLGLSPGSRILLEFDEESHRFSMAAVREWTQQFAVQVGWNIGPLRADDEADACLMLRRGDGKPFKGRSNMIPATWTSDGPDRGAT